mgnify:CR=1 FL=1
MAKIEREFAVGGPCTNCGLVRFESNGERLLRSVTPGWTTPCRWCESWRANDDELWPKPSERAPDGARYRNLVAMLRGRAASLNRSTIVGASLYVDLQEAADAIEALSVPVITPIEQADIIVAGERLRAAGHVEQAAAIDALMARLSVGMCLCATAADVGAPEEYGGDQVIAHVHPDCPLHGDPAAALASWAAAATQASMAASRCSKTVPGIDSVEPWPCSLLAGHEGDCE